MQYTPHAKLDIPRGVPKELVPHLEELMGQVRNEFKKISASINKTGTTTIISATPSSASGGGTATVVSYRTGAVSVSVGTTYIPFSSPLSGLYNLILELYTLDGQLSPQATTPTNIPQSSSGFSITTQEALIVKYTAIEIQ